MTGACCLFLSRQHLDVRGWGKLATLLVGTLISYGDGRMLFVFDSSRLKVERVAKNCLSGTVLW